MSVSGGFEYGYWGEIMATMAQARGLAGLVIDGGVRDGRLLAEMGWPTFSRGLAIRGTGKDVGAIGWIGPPISVGEVSVQRGDLVFGDVDGVVVLPRDQAADVVDKGFRREADEADKIVRLRNGASTMQLLGLK